MAIETRSTAAASAAPGTAVAVLAAISICHMLNDVIQSLIMAIYPMLKESLSLDFRQIGLITFTFHFTASLLQPLVGFVTDRYPTPYSLVLGMGCSLLGLIIARFCLDLSAGACSPRPDRHGIFGVSPRVLARGPARLRRPARPRAIGVSGRRQFRHGARSAARGLRRAALRAGAASPGSPSSR